MRLQRKRKKIFEMRWGCRSTTLSPELPVPGVWVCFPVTRSPVKNADLLKYPDIFCQVSWAPFAMVDGSTALQRVLLRGYLLVDGGFLKSHSLSCLQKLFPQWASSAKYIERIVFINQDRELQSCQKSISGFWSAQEISDLSQAPQAACSRSWPLISEVTGAKTRGCSATKMPARSSGGGDIGTALQQQWTHNSGTTGQTWAGERTREGKRQRKSHPPFYRHLQKEALLVQGWARAAKQTSPPRLCSMWRWALPTPGHRASGLVMTIHLK